MNPLAGVLPAKARKVAYAMFGVAALLVAATRVAFDSIDRSLPPWLVAVSTAVTFLATAFAALAAANTTSEPDEQRSRARRAMPDEVHGGDTRDINWDH